MPGPITIGGIIELKGKFAKYLNKYGTNPKPKIVVGYTQKYAVYVHEILTNHHPVGQAKFLEQPAREMNSSGEGSKIVKSVLQGGGTLEQALYTAGLELQRRSQQICPVDTGALKASAFTEISV